jgi:hypothetical protein
MHHNALVEKAGDLCGEKVGKRLAEQRKTPANAKCEYELGYDL